MGKEKWLADLRSALADSQRQSKAIEDLIRQVEALPDQEPTPQRTPEEIKRAFTQAARSCLRERIKPGETQAEVTEKIAGCIADSEAPYTRPRLKGTPFVRVTRRE